MNPLFDRHYQFHVLPKYSPSKNIENIDNLDTKNNIYHINNRLDLKNISVYSIDPEGCEDADDAFSIWEEEDNLFLAIHIADPTHYFSPHSDIFNTICENVITHYPSGNKPIHLMPKNILDKANLMIKDKLFQEQNAISIITQIDKNTYLPIGNIDIKCTKIMLNKENSLSYTNCYPNDNISEFFNRDRDISIALKIGNSLRTNRNTVGKLLSNLDKSYIQFKDNMFSLKKDTKEEKKLKQMIEEFAIFANTCVGKYLQIKLEGLGIFRSCETEHILDNDIKDGNKLMDMIIEKGIQANYINNIKRHDLVGMPVYCHFTSPLRRATDCVCHFLLKSIILNIPSPFTKLYLDKLAQKFDRVTKIERKLQYYDNKFRIIEVIDNILRDPLNNVFINVKYNGYTGLFLNLMIDEIIVNNTTYNISLSYCIRIPGYQFIRFWETFRKATIKINSVNIPLQFDEGSIPDLDVFVIKPNFT
uniref:RNB domain-containing protein n=1 Tax=viral metagenome TaxID=1070528 RepID=A0A6C0JCT9_9ZZZZ